MLDNDELTYSYQKRPKIAGNSRQAERALISVDRSQKLDLLVHLLTNLQQSLIVCGPDGIGKTTLLQTVAENYKDTWPICLLPGSGAVSFESVVAELSRALNLGSASVNFDLSSLRAFCDKQKVVLIIDDAGGLMPGLIGELIDFADSLTGLRLVLAMNSDELQEKAGSDSAIDECHFIELPPLNLQQCREYLQNLSAQPGSPLSFSAITDTLVEDMYLQTQGVPGRIVAELPKFKEYQHRHGRRIGLWFGIVVVLAAAGYAVKAFMPADLLGGAIPETALQQEQAQLPNKPVVSTPAPAIEPTVQVRDSAAPAGELLPESLLGKDLNLAADLPESPGEQVVAEPEMSEEKPAETIPAPPVESVAAAEPAGSEAGQPADPAVTAIQQPEPEPEDSKPLEKQPAAEVKPAEKPVAPVVEQKPVPAKAASSESDGGDIDWIMAQPADNYTVQVMVLSSKASVTRFIRKYAEYRDGLKYYVIGKQGQEKYVIIYGSFASSIEALNTKSDMPSEFNGGLVKRFKQVQRASRRR
ncbi:AAA family ATPase [Methylomonas methanica]|uniref:Sporulation domain-containing protein n=1 Tax=Methylomonas methanica (strain DSM 25384 / MC09) TaxID=857087 RepID=G0A1H5_METMM|nr:AAA family ATPase [Methylomonas methanica]AEF98868.1 Sporulation domain-containing protein [Methylomonas methanica MC09]